VNAGLPPRTTALITGASGGIGRELARVCAAHGHDLVLVARSEAKLEALAAELRAGHGVSVTVMASDLVVPDAARTLVDDLHRAAIRVDLLVNNAGFDVYGYFHETDLATELSMIQVNLVALTQLTKLVLADMRAQGSGRILNVGSTGSFIPSPLNAVYAATKAYVLSFSEALAEELRGAPVSVTALCPGATRTGFQARAGIGQVRLVRWGMMDATTVAEAGYRAMMAGRRVVVPGLFNNLSVLGTRLLPRSIMIRTAKAMLQPSGPRRGGR
jgi:uncharacterized protein